MTENTLLEVRLPKAHNWNIKEHLAFRPNWGWAFAFCFLVLALKNDLHEVFYPLLYNEDGRQIFINFYNGHAFKNIFYFYAGYIRIFPNLVGYLLHYFPLPVIPALYALVSLLFTAFVYSLFYRVLNHVFGDRWFAFYASILIIILPQANFEFVGTLMYQIWHCVIALFALTFLPLPEKTWKRILQIILMHTFIWTHPFSFLALPFYLYRAIRQSEYRLENGIFAVSILCYFIFAVIHHPLHWEAFHLYPETLVSRVGVEAVVGPYNRGWLIYMGMTNVFGIIVFSLIGLILWVSRREMKVTEKWFIIIMAYFLLVPLAASILGRDLNEYYPLLRGSPRYTYISRLAFLLIILSALFVFYRKSKIFQMAHWVLLMLVLWVNSTSSVLYETSVSEGKDILDYIAYVDENRLECGEGEEKMYYFRRGRWQTPGAPGDWSISSNLCRH
ncbi:MAG: hypothetical protein OEZ51_08235 [Nitrospinota bacterium]|nr:hypothetical protein [Nitrospinota bacterium]